MGGGGGGGRGKYRSEKGLTVIGVCAVLFVEHTGYVHGSGLFSVTETFLDVMDISTVRVEFVFT